MRLRTIASLITVVLLVGTGLSAAPAGAGHNDDDHSDNFKELARKPIVIDEGVLAEGSDLAFKGNLVIAGSFQGLGTFKILGKRAGYLKQLGFAQCTGGQGDVTVFGDHVFFSVDSPRVGPTCSPEDSAGASNAVHIAGQAWEGLRIFDISDPARPKWVGGIDIPCGSHTNTLLPGKTKSYIYIESYPLGAQGQDCSVASHRKIQIVEFPNSDPTKAKLLDATIDVSPMIGCHDITTFPDRGLMAGACINQSRIWDISKDPTAPELLATIENEDMQIHHSTAVTWDNKILVLGDEYGGAAAPGGCNGDEESTVGAAWFYDVSDPTNPTLMGHHALPRVPPFDDSAEGQRFRCTNHNFNVIPFKNPSKYWLAVSYYMGGIAVVDFTDPSDPTEIGHYLTQPGGVAQDTWAAYWYNGRIYTNDYLSKLGIGVYKFKGTGRKQTYFFQGEMNPQVQFEGNLRK